MSETGSRAGADLYITDRCGFNCKHCFLGADLNSGQQMSVSTVRAIADFLGRADVTEISLLGGEPFQHPDLLEIVDQLGVAGSAVRIVTNGFRQAEKILRSERLPLGVKLAFSVDGGHAEVHDGIRRPGSHAQLTRTSRLAQNMGYRTSAILSLSKQNYLDLPDILSFCAESGFQRLTVHHVTARGNAAQNQVLGAVEWRSVLETITEFSMTTDMRIRCEDPFFLLDPEAPLQCSVRDRTNMMFFPDGQVYSCLLFRDSGIGGGAHWDGVNAVPASGYNEFAACRGVENHSSCPASGLVKPGLYQQNPSTRIRCIYDKVSFEPGH